MPVGVGCWVLGVGCWVLGVGCWVLGVGCWVLGAGGTDNQVLPQSLTFVQVKVSLRKRLATGEAPLKFP